ncbi:MAG: McrB family protein [bacterium]
MEFIKQQDLDKIITYAKEEITGERHTELREVYNKLDYLCKLLEKKGFSYDIRRDPRKQAGKGKFAFQDYHWARIYPKELYQACKDKFAYIIGLSNTLQFHMMGIGDYKDKSPSLEASKASWTDIDINNSNYESVVQEFIKFDDTYRSLFIKTGAQLGINECIQIKKNMDIQRITDILNSKKQIILQGAPGTGKTYLTAELALKIIGKSPSNNSREAIMEAYHQAVEEGQIVFTTFHQSMDYEEFIEGLKPVNLDEVEDENNGDDYDNSRDIAVRYKVQPGIFKRLCTKAGYKNAFSFEQAYKKLIEDLSSEDVTDNTKPSRVINPKGGTSFGISVNRNKNLTLYTGENLRKSGSITKENILRELAGEKYFIGWQKYFRGVIGLLETEYGFTQHKEETGKNYVLIIDEINRGNISKIFGELITLLEPDKRIGELNEIKVQLPYTPNEDPFGVPSNLYIIGTMNTADRSLGYIDYAVRRRFAFVSIKAEKDQIEKYYANAKADLTLSEKAISLFEEIQKIINDDTAYDFDKEDIMIGHSYFMANNLDELKLKYEFEIKPLLMEYVKDGVLTLSKDDLREALNKLWPLS